MAVVLQARQEELVKHRQHHIAIQQSASMAAVLQAQQEELVIHIAIQQGAPMAVVLQARQEELVIQPLNFAMPFL